MSGIREGLPKYFEDTEELEAFGLSVMGYYHERKMGIFTSLTSFEITEAEVTSLIDNLNSIVKESAREWVSAVENEISRPNSETVTIDSVSDFDCKNTPETLRSYLITRGKALYSLATKKGIREDLRLGLSLVFSLTDIAKTWETDRELWRETDVYQFCEERKLPVVYASALFTLVFGILTIERLGLWMLLKDFMDRAVPDVHYPSSLLKKKQDEFYVEDKEKFIKWNPNHNPKARKRCISEREDIMEIVEKALEGSKFKTKDEIKEEIRRESVKIKETIVSYKTAERWLKGYKNKKAISKIS